MTLLDLGCGQKKRPGHIGIDNSPLSAADIRCDIEKGIPLRSGSCAGVVCDNLLEHMRDLIGVMNEIWRVCADGAKVEVVVPHYLSIGAFQDPTHVRHFTEKSFLYFNQSLPYDYGFRGRFEIETITLDKNPEFEQEVKGIPFDIARKYFMNSIRFMIVILRADKKYRR